MKAQPPGLGLGYNKAQLFTDLWVRKASAVGDYKGGVSPLDTSAQLRALAPQGKRPGLRAKAAIPPDFSPALGPRPLPKRARGPYDCTQLHIILHNSTVAYIKGRTIIATQDSTAAGF